MKENRTIKSFRKALRRDFGKETAERMLSSFDNRYSALLEENPGESEELQEHTSRLIYPAIAMADTLQKFGRTRSEAVEWLYDEFERAAESEAASMRMMLKIPFAYRLVPGMFLKVQKRDFGEEAGFVSKVVLEQKDHTVFHMLKCPYNDAFRRYGYPELIRCFCHQDDVKNGRMHPRLKWSRRHTLACDGPYCDFSMEIVDRK